MIAIDKMTAQTEESNQSVEAQFALQDFESVALEIFVGHFVDGNSVRPGHTA